MTTFPAVSLTPLQQQRLLREVYLLLDNQVKSYHKYRHMGTNSSVSADTAQELLRSIWYTIDIGSGYNPNLSLEKQLKNGQDILKEAYEQCTQLYALTYATSPECQNQYRWQTLRDLDRFLQNYDFLHLAHRVPDMLDYPLPVPVPEQLSGIGYAQFYLNCLWAENQLLDAFPAPHLLALIDRMPPDYWEAPQNLCEPVLLCAAGSVLVHASPLELEISISQQRQIADLLTGKTVDEVHSMFSSAILQLCDRLHILSDSVRDYAAASVDQFLPRLMAALPGRDLSLIFL